MSDIEISLSQWWFKKRLVYNKGLLFIGLMGFLLQALLQVFESSRSINLLLSDMYLSGICLFAFLVLANAAFALGWLLDFLFNNENSQSFRDWLFWIGYGFAVVMLILCIGVFLLFTRADTLPRDF
jgi:hypothetical protein